MENKELITRKIKFSKDTIEQLNEVLFTLLRINAKDYQKYINNVLGDAQVPKIFAIYRNDSRLETQIHRSSEHIGIMNIIGVVRSIDLRTMSCEINFINSSIADSIVSALDYKSECLCEFRINLSGYDVHNANTMPEIECVDLIIKEYEF